MEARRSVPSKWQSSEVKGLSRWRSRTDISRGQGFDLPAVQPRILRHTSVSMAFPGRISFQAGDFFADPLPSADVLVMGHVLHDWDLHAEEGSD